MGNYTYIPPFYNMELGGNYEATHGFDGNGGHGLEGVAWWRLKQWMWQLQGRSSSGFKGRVEDFTKHD